MDGILLVNKPVLWTSHDVVDFVRRRIGQRAVGHAGTLDPLATGLLVMLLGKATKLSDSLRGKDKDYVGTMTLGVATDTMDLEGRVTASHDASGVSRERLESAVSEFLGKQKQAPPAHSAVKKGGKPLYEWSRRGIAPQTEERDIAVEAFSISAYEAPEAAFFLSCSKGTYVRSLCDAVGRRLGVGATLSSLVRTRVGNFALDAALTCEALACLARKDIESRLIVQSPLPA